MGSITKWFPKAIFRPVPALDCRPIPGKAKGKLRLTPEQLLSTIHGQEIADWSLRVARVIQPPRLKRGLGGRPAIYQDHSILLMAIVPTVWCKPYEQIVDYVANNPGLATALGFAPQRTISQGQYWERRAAARRVLLPGPGSTVDASRCDPGSGVDR